MAQIFVDTSTNDTFRTGRWQLRIIAGLDEDYEAVIKEASCRLASAIEAIDKRKRYPHYGA